MFNSAQVLWFCCVMSLKHILYYHGPPLYDFCNHRLKRSSLIGCTIQIREKGLKVYRIFIVVLFLQCKAGWENVLWKFGWKYKWFFAVIEQRKNICVKFACLDSLLLQYFKKDLNYLILISLLKVFLLFGMHWSESYICLNRNDT